MSGFLVIVHFDGTPVEDELAQKLGQLVAYHGPDASGTHSFPGVVLVHHLMRKTRACAADVQPMVATDGRSAVVCDARFDQRDSLIRSISDSGVKVAPDAPSSRLLLQAYSLWGQGLLDHIAGDYSFILVDLQSRRVLAARDPFGLRTLYYGRFANGLILSNDPLPVMAHPKVDLVLDRLAMADFLLIGRVTAIDRTQTPFKDVNQLAGGHCLTVDLDSGQIETRRYWHFPMDSRPLYYRSLADYGEHFRSVLKKAVGDRIDVPTVVAPLSGGMDSTTVVAIAAEVMKDGNGPDSFTAVTAVLNDEDPEGLLAAELCRALGIPHHRIEARAGRPLARWSCSPFPSTEFFAVYGNNQRVAARFGRLSLNASSADYALFPEHFSILNQLRAGGLRDTWRALRIMKSRYGYRTRLGSGLYSRMRGSTPKNPYARPIFAYPGWLSASLEREYDLRERWDNFWTKWPCPSHPLRPTAHRMITARDRLSMHSLAWPLDFSPPVPADPFLDQRMIEFLWSLPPLPWFYNKHLTRTAMQGRLPESILRRVKTPARRWAPTPSEGNIDFSWQPGPVIKELVDESRLPDLNAGQESPADFHPMFLQRWLSSFEEVFFREVGKRVQLSVS